MGQRAGDSPRSNGRRSKVGKVAIERLTDEFRPRDASALGLDIELFDEFIGELDHRLGAAHSPTIASLVSWRTARKESTVARRPEVSPLQPRRLRRPNSRPLNG